MVPPPGYQDHPDLDLYAYIYRYDYLDRLVYKKLPGCAPSYLVYDAAHRLVFSQDGCQRNDSLWSFFVYDVYGRVVVEGECSNSDKHVRTAGETVVLGTLMEGDTGLAYSGYQSSFDLVEPCVYVVNYYDTYDFRTRNGFSAYNFPEGTVSATGNLTGSILCTHGSSGFIYSADYYDINKRIVKSLSSRVNGGMDTYATEYSFQGSPLSVLHTHRDSSGYSLTERYTYTYDHSSRLTRVSHQYDNNPSVLLVEHAYDELGRLQTDKLDNGIYATAYAYNIRNWLTGIEGGKFSQSLHYTDGLGVPCYNGNISSMTWKSGAGATPRGYKFSYDRLGRLTDAEYGEGPSLSVNTNRFNEQVTGYDKMGNILGLKRYGQTSATGYDVIDDLSLSYAGNRLKKVTDRSTTPAFNNGFEFKDGVDLSTEYEYDENGNLTKDLNKNITAIQYNCLNLPSRVMFANGNSISYLYDAAGRKLRTVHVLEGDSVTTDYCGNVVYENGVPQILLTEVGYVSLTDGKYHYYLKDHQGNNRVVVDEEGTVEEVNHYYPFGGVFSSTGDAQPYKYNGKELDRKGGLDWYDYGARMYDAALGRFMKTDRFSEKYVSLSPYQYGANNPVNNIDVNGDSITVLNYGYIRKQHMAILIQNDAGEWQYFSVNGDNVYVSGEFSGGRKFNDIAVGEFDSPQEFLNSPYNSYGASDDMSINTYGFSEGYMIPTSKEQDDIIRDTFISISKNESYDFLGNNCSTVVQKSLEAAGIITFTQKSTRHRIPSSHYLGESSFIATISTSRPVIPSVSFRAIIKNNPQGKMIYR